MPSSVMRPERHAKREYVEAFRELVQRIAEPLAAVPKRALPIQMYVAGGAAMHFYTGERISLDVDAAFSHRIALPENLEVAYRDTDGAARLLYLDRNYSDTLALLHEDAYDDSVALTLDGIDPKVMGVRLLSPVDLAVSKLGRFAEHDRNDIASLARHGLISSRALRERAEDALGGYVGALDRVRGSIEIGCRIVAETEQSKRRK
jgi:hypothetical protein